MHPIVPAFDHLVDHGAKPLAPFMVAVRYRVKNPQLARRQPVQVHQLERHGEQVSCSSASGGRRLAIWSGGFLSIHSAYDARLSGRLLLRKLRDSLLAYNGWLVEQEPLGWVKRCACFEGESGKHFRR